MTTTPSYADGAGDTSALVSATSGTAPPASVVPPGESGLSYTLAGEVSSVTPAGGGASSYVYDAAGGLVLQKDPSATILYLFGGAEQLTLASGAKAATGLRLYSAADGTVIARASSGTNPVSYLVGDRQGTSAEAINATTLALTRRYFDPYGNAVGTNPASWPDNRGFVGPAEAAMVVAVSAAEVAATTTFHF